MKQILPHISIGMHDDGRTILVVDDYELFDFVDDYLTDDCDLAYEFRTSTERSGGEIITMYFPSAVIGSEIEGAVLRLDVTEVERIYKLNNQAE